MVAVGSGWTILPPLAVAHSLARDDRVRALPLPGKPFQRRIVIASQKGEGRHIALQIHNAALDALRERFLPKLRVTLPHIVDRIVLHTTAAK